MPLQIRRGTNAERLLMSQPLAAGELLYVTDDQRLYVGNGATLGGVAVTGYTDEDARDASAALFTNGSHTGITFTYNDVLDTIDAVVDFSTLNTLVADSFQGSLFADDSTLLVDAVDGTFNLDGTIKGDIVPNVSEAYDIGTPSAKFKDLYLSGSSLFLGDASITASGSAINLPAGSTVGGIEIGLIADSFISDLKGSVFGDDSTVLVNAVDGTLSSRGLTLEDENVYSTNGEAVTIYSTSETAQSQVKFPMVAAATIGGDILTAAGDWKFIEILGSKASLNPTLDLASGDVLGVFNIAGVQSNGSDMGAVIGAQVDPAGTVTSSWIPTKLFFGNTPDNISAVNVPFMTFDSFGRLAVNQQNASATLDINGFAKLAVLTAAPATPANGMVAIADGDSAGGWDPLGLGAPAKQQMVVYLGGGWRAIAQEP